ncbi:MAG TPA: hypothetical protein VIK98_00575 [Limnochordales bacterium]
MSANAHGRLASAGAGGLAARALIPVLMLILTFVARLPKGRWSATLALGAGRLGRLDAEG